MATPLVKQLIDTGIHYGHKSSGWNPKMKPYIYGKRNGIHIIDIRETIKGMLLAKKFLQKVVAGGKDVLFVGTKRQARPAIEDVCDEVGMHYVTERWLGGMLTNFRTIRSRLKRLEELETLMASEDWQHYSKKMASVLTRERNKIHRNLSGIRNMGNLPGALVVIDVHREHTALAEAKKLGIPTICLIDTDSDPDIADIPIPGNDDAMRAIEIVLRQLGAAIQAGKAGRKISDKTKSGDDDSGDRPRRRSSRARFRADDDGSSASSDDAPAATATAEAPKAEEPKAAEAPAEDKPAEEKPAE